MEGLGTQRLLHALSLDGNAFPSRAVLAPLRWLPFLRKLVRTAPWRNACFSSPLFFLSPFGPHSGGRWGGCPSSESWCAHTSHATRAPYVVLGHVLQAFVFTGGPTSPAGLEGRPSPSP